MHSITDLSVVNHINVTRNVLVVLLLAVIYLDHLKNCYIM